ncbi:MAG: hypothetical protein B7X04_01665 [Parcubacteria group bacterium 21-54-25]|nr:MAG: hypothetical protein B7X04_01665 [Parcubacteria group bacterium 21-54-25]HQU07632.1 hypothetical protein [Candidatus Paceibacterota bacterium]
MASSPALSAFPTAPLPVSFALSATHVLPLVFATIFVLWLITTVVAFYHWRHYNHASPAFVPSLVVYGAGSLVLILYAASGFVG